MHGLKNTLVVLSLAGLCAACGSSTASAVTATATAIAPLASFSENGVAVEIKLEAGPSGADHLVARFTPEQDGFHLYSHRLPREGVNGQGRPTLLEVPAQEALRPTGELVANQPSVLEPPALLVFPDGPVTLSLPVERTGEAQDAVLSVTYMTCSARTCLIPVIDKRIAVVLP